MLEYQYDQVNNSLNDNDAFFALRWVENDVQDTELLLGVLVDKQNHSSRILSLEYKTRLNNALLLTVNGFVFSGSDSANPVSLLRDEDHVSISLSYFF